MADVTWSEPALCAAFAGFFAAPGGPERLRLLESLSLTLRTVARHELDRFRQQVTDAAARMPEPNYDEDEEEGAGGGGGGVRSPAATGRQSGSAKAKHSPRTQVEITEEEESYEEDGEDDGGAAGARAEAGAAAARGDDGGDALAAMNRALAATLTHLGVDATTRAALVGCDDDGVRGFIVAAIDVFQQTKDVGDLKDTLRRLARRHQKDKDAAAAAALEARVAAAEGASAAQDRALAQLESPGC